MGIATGSTGDTDLDMEYQQSFLEDSLSQVFMAYDEAVGAGIDQPVVILLDCDDPIGGRVAQAWLGAETIAHARSSHEARLRRNMSRNSSAGDSAASRNRSQRTAPLSSDQDQGAAEEMQGAEPTNKGRFYWVQAFPWEHCCQEVPPVFPYLAPIFQQDAPGDGFLAISVTSGGASVLTVPGNARENWDESGDRGGR
jgi:hypothetical protein